MNFRAAQSARTPKEFASLIQNENTSSPGMNWEKFEEGEALTLKGFLFQTQNGRWILSQEPALKSCCVGAQHKQKSQVVLDGDFSHFSTKKPLCVKGIWHIDHQTGAYAMLNAEAGQKAGAPIVTVCVLLLCALLFKLKRLLLP